AAEELLFRAGALTSRPPLPLPGPASSSDSLAFAPPPPPGWSSSCAAELLRATRRGRDRREGVPLAGCAGDWPAAGCALLRAAGTCGRVAGDLGFTAAGAAPGTALGSSPS